MATATATSSTPTAEPPDRIRHPLVRLRGTIRRYIILEGTLAVALVLALWFWIGLALDFGSFKLFGFDWVQEWPRWVRGGLLSAALTGVAAVVITKLVRRLTVDFRPRALALVLERKFPETLGDRLITAVELADLDRAESQGYSRAMIAETVREAGDRVATVPVHDVFAWLRLRRQAVWLLAAAWLPFLLFGIAYSTVKHTDPREDFLPRFRESAVTWLRRDVLLQNVIWPRKAYLEVLDFPESGDLRVGRDAPSPRLRVKARRWVFADAAAPEGWRAMTWSDLTPALLGRDVPSLPVELLEPGRIVAVLAGLAGGPVNSVAAGQSSDWTLDRVNIALEDAAIRQRLADHRPDIIIVFEALEARAAEPGLRSTLRRLQVPERVEVKYWGLQTSNRMELLRGPGWEYSGTLGDLKESVQFWARGADYYTATCSITLVPPPALQQLKRIEFRPAYLYHRPPTDGGPPALRGLHQRVEDFVGLNGDTSRFAVPEGTDLVLEGQLDKDLESVILRSRSRTADERRSAQELALTDDRLGFRHRFERIAAPLDFDLEFTDTDGVKSSRHVVIDAIRDLPPTVNVVIDGIRKTNQGPYLVTPIAMIPFEGKVVDGLAGALGGLDRVDYSLNLSRVESPTTVGERAAWLAAAFLPAIGGGRDHRIISAAATAEVARVVAAVSAETTARTFTLETFQQRLRDLALRDVPRAELTRRLDLPPGPPPLVRDLVLQPKFEFLDLRDRLPDLKSRGEDEVQPRFRMKLTVTATDNNIETGPGVGVNKEPPFTVLIVSEAELLVEIARDEEALHLKTEDAVARLREARQKLEKVAEELPAAPPGALPTLAQRSLEVAEAVVKARDVVQEVATEYNRILRELELNRVSPRIVEKVKGEICLPLESALRGEFVRAEESMELYRKELEAARKPDEPLTAQVRDRLDQLIAKLAQVMAAMGDVTTINKLIAALREIEKGQEQAVGARLRELQRLQREKLLEKLKGLDDKKE